MHGCNWCLGLPLKVETLHQLFNKFWVLVEMKMREMDSNRMMMDRPKQKLRQWPRHKLEPNKNNTKGNKKNKSEQKRREGPTKRRKGNKWKQKKKDRELLCKSNNRNKWCKNNKQLNKKEWWCNSNRCKCRNKLKCTKGRGKAIMSFVKEKMNEMIWDKMVACLTIQMLLSPLDIWVEVVLL